MSSQARVRVLTYLTAISCLGLVEAIQGGAKHLLDDRFMSDVNLEHYYVIEENALSNAEILLRDDYFGPDDEEEEEDDDVHLQHAPNLTMFKSIIDEAKTVHRLAGPDLEAFLAHPINVYHLFRRLDNGWREGLEMLLQTKPCKKWNLPLMVGRLRYLIDNLPGTEELARVVEYMAKLQNIYRINVKDIADGKIGDYVALKPLSIEDQFQIVKVLRDRDDMRTSLLWLQQINERLLQLSPAQRRGLDFNQIDIFNLMASAYYEMRRISDALEKTEKVLELDPTNRVARSNHLFFTNKLELEKTTNGIRSTAASGKRLSKYERLCGRNRQRKVAKKKCLLVRVGLQHYKVEPIRQNPYIVLYHNVVSNKTADILKSYAHETQTEQAWISEETFTPPTFSVDLSFLKVTRNSVMKEVRSLQRQLFKLSNLARVKPESWDRLQVINVGLEGMHLNEHRPELRLHQPAGQKSLKEMGTYFSFLNDVKIGGEVVFMDNNIVIHPDKGSVLFYYHSKGPLHSFCPVIGSSLWVAVQPLRERPKTYSVDDDEWL